jgi:vitamin B12 transporter
MIGWRGVWALAVLSTWALPATAQTESAAAPLEVTVRGEAQLPASPRDPTAASTVVRNDELRAPGASSADILARVPGVQVTRTGAQSDLATASLRGASSAQTPVYLAGVRLNDDVTGTADLSTVPLWMLDRAEIYRGSAPEHADELGLGGAVFFEPRLPSRSLLNAGVLLGSFGTLGSWLSGAACADEASALVSVRRDRALNDYSYRNDQGTVFNTGDDQTTRRENADFEAVDSWAIARFRPNGQARVTTVLNAFDREQGVTGLAVIPAARSRAWTRRELAAVSAALPCAAARHGPWRCRLELVSSALAARSALEDPWEELGLQTWRVDSRGQRVAQAARLHYAVGERVTLGMSGSQSLETLRSVYQQLSELRAGREVTRLSLSAALSAADPLVLFALGALERHATSPTAGAERWDGAQPSGRVGLSLRALRWLTLLGNLGRYARVPTLGELYGVSPLVRGNAQLSEEVGISSDLGVRAATFAPARSGFSGYLEAFAYQRRVDGLIAYQRTSFRQIGPYNVGSARLQGLELAGGGVWFDQLRLQSAVSLLDPRDTTAGRSYTNDILPYHSRLVLSHWVQVFSRLAWTSLPVSYASLGLRVVHRSSRHQNPAGLGPIPGQSSVDLEGTAKLQQDRVGLRVLIANLLDSPHYDVVGLPLPGRSVYASVEATWW